MASSADLPDALADWQVQFDTDFHYETGWISEDLAPDGRNEAKNSQPRSARRYPDHPPPRRSLACRTTKALAMVQAVTTLTHFSLGPNQTSTGGATPI